MLSCSQLPHLSELYTTEEVYDHIQPIVLNLTVDQVSQVRQASFVAVSVFQLLLMMIFPEIQSYDRKNSGLDVIKNN